MLISNHVKRIRTQKIVSLNLTSKLGEPDFILMILARQLWSQYISRTKLLIVSVTKRKCNEILRWFLNVYEYNSDFTLSL